MKKYLADLISNGEVYQMFLTEMQLQNELQNGNVIWYRPLTNAELLENLLHSA